MIEQIQLVFSEIAGRYPQLSSNNANTEIMFRDLEQVHGNVLTVANLVEIIERRRADLAWAETPKAPSKLAAKLAKASTAEKIEFATGAKPTGRISHRILDEQRAKRAEAANGVDVEGEKAEFRQRLAQAAVTEMINSVQVCSRNRVSAEKTNKVREYLASIKATTNGKVDWEKTAREVYDVIRRLPD